MCIILCIIYSCSSSSRSKHGEFNSRYSGGGVNLLPSSATATLKSATSVASSIEPPGIKTSTINIKYKTATCVPFSSGSCARYHITITATLILSCTITASSSNV